MDGPGRASSRGIFYSVVSERLDLLTKILYFAKLNSNFKKEEKMGKGLQLCCSEKEIKTLKAKTDKGESFKAGDMIEVGCIVGLVAEDVSEKSEFMLIYEAAKVRVPKKRGYVFKVGGFVYIEGDPREHQLQLSVTPERHYGQVERTACGIALEDAKSHDNSVLIDLMVFA